jgi:hypothetical protein
VVTPGGRGPAARDSESRSGARGDDDSAEEQGGVHPGDEGVSAGVAAAVRSGTRPPPIRRDMCAVVAAGHPATGAAQALLDILVADISR